MHDYGIYDSVSFEAMKIHFWKAKFSFDLFMWYLLK